MLNHTKGPTAETLDTACRLENWLRVMVPASAAKTAATEAMSSLVGAMVRAMRSSSVYDDDARTLCQPGSLESHRAAVIKEFLWPITDPPRFIRWADSWHNELRAELVDNTPFLPIGRVDTDLASESRAWIIGLLACLNLADQNHVVSAIELRTVMDPIYAVLTDNLASPATIAVLRNYDLRKVFDRAVACVQAQEPPFYGALTGVLGKVRRDLSVGV